MNIKAIGLLVITLVALIPWVSGYTVSSLVLTVYSDGYVKVNYEVMPGDYESQIQLPLLGQHSEDFVVEDGNGNPLDFRVENGSLLIYTGDATLVNIYYYTPDLTSKEGIVWTLHVQANTSFTVILPEKSIVVDLSDIPLEIAGNSITMPPGNQSISYTLEERATSGGERSAPVNASPILLVVGGMIFAAGAVYFGLKKFGSLGSTMPSKEEFEERIGRLELTEDEKRALLYIFDKGGRASQAEVREALGIPKTTAWRMFKRLERKGLLKILRGKKENWVELRF